MADFYPTDRSKSAHHWYVIEHLGNVEFLIGYIYYNVLQGIGMFVIAMAQTSFLFSLSFQEYVSKGISHPVF